MCIYVLGGAHVTLHTCEGQTTTCGGCFSPFFMWILGVEHRSLARQQAPLPSEPYHQPSTTLKSQSYLMSTGLHCGSTEGSRKNWRCLSQGILAWQAPIHFPRGLMTSGERASWTGQLRSASAWKRSQMFVQEEGMRLPG